MRADQFRRFFARRLDEKKDTTKKSQKGYISPICREFPTQPNLTKIGMSLGVTDIINRTKIGNDQSRAYKVTDSQILPWSIEMARRL